MTTEVWNRLLTTQAGADLVADNFKHKAVTVGGTIAANNATAVGLLKSTGKTGENISVACEGEIKAVAGAAITKGDRLTVTTSGFIITATDSRSNVGRALETAASGDLFRGLFSFISNT